MVLSPSASHAMRRGALAAALLGIALAVGCGGGSRDPESERAERLIRQNHEAGYSGQRQMPPTKVDCRRVGSRPGADAEEKPVFRCEATFPGGLVDTCEVFADETGCVPDQRREARLTIACYERVGVPVPRDLRRLALGHQVNTNLRRPALSRGERAALRNCARQQVGQ
jgi:hypothetical protein